MADHKKAVPNCKHTGVTAVLYSAINIIPTRTRFPFFQKPGYFHYEVDKEK